MKGYCPYCKAELIPAPRRKKNTRNAVKPCMYEMMANSSYLNQKGLDRKRVNILKRSVPPVIKVSDRRTLIS